MHDAVGYRKTCDFMAFACIGYSIFFFIFNVGIFIFREERKIREKRKALLEMMEENGNKSINEDQEEEIEDFIKKNPYSPDDKSFRV